VNVGQHQEGRVRGLGEAGVKEKILSQPGANIKSSAERGLRGGIQQNEGDKVRNSATFTGSRDATF